MKIVSLFCVGFYFIHGFCTIIACVFQQLQDDQPRLELVRPTEKKFRRKAYEKKGKNVSVQKFCFKDYLKCRQPYKSFLVDSSLTFHFHLFISLCVSLWPPFHVFISVFVCLFLMSITLYLFIFFNFFHCIFVLFDLFIFLFVSLHHPIVLSFYLSLFVDLCTSLSLYHSISVN